MLRVGVQWRPIEMKPRFLVPVILAMVMGFCVLGGCRATVPPEPGKVGPSVSQQVPEPEQPEKSQQPEQTQPEQPGDGTASPTGEETVQQADPQPEPQPEPAPEPEPEPQPEPQPEPAPEPEPQPQPQPQPEPQPQPQPQPEPQPQKNTTLHILMYHDVIQGDGSSCGDWTVTDQRFREDLQWLEEHGYTTVLPSEVISGQPLPDKAVLITFDDGYASNYNLAYPILKEFQDKAVISMIVARTADGRPDFLTWAIAKEMEDSGLVEIGSHTYDSHKEDPRGIKRMKGESQEAYQTRIFTDLEDSIRLIEDNTGYKVNFFAYPHGQTEPWANDFLAQHFAMTVTTDHGAANIGGGLYNLPRYNINMKQPPSKFLPA